MAGWRNLLDRIDKRTWPAQILLRLLTSTVSILSELLRKETLKRRRTLGREQDASSSSSSAAASSSSSSYPSPALTATARQDGKEKVRDVF